MPDTSGDALVFFGATGDLAYQQIFPALQALTRRGQLEMPMIGVAKPDWTADQLRTMTECVALVVRDGALVWTARVRVARPSLAEGSAQPRGAWGRSDIGVAGKEAWKWSTTIAARPHAR